MISNLGIALETNTVTFALGLGLYDLEKIFVTMEEGHIQLFSNRYLSGKYTIKEIEKIKGHAHNIVRVTTVCQCNNRNNRFQPQCR